jgi:tetratricopeptide (TPR) repeat protein
MAQWLQPIAFFFLTCCHLSSPSEDAWIGKRVFLKDSAVAANGTKVVEMYRVLSRPAEVEEVKGNMLRIGRFWVNKSDCMELQEAFDYYNEEVRKSPNLSKAWSARSACWIEKGELNNALKDSDEAIRLDPENASAYRSRGYAKIKLQDFKSAIKDYDEFIRLDPENASAYRNRGSAKSELQDFKSAIKDYDEAIRLDPKNVYAYLNRGYSLFLKMLSNEIQRRFKSPWGYIPLLQDLGSLLEHQLTAEFA